jgi:hypothetical protein
VPLDCDGGPYPVAIGAQIADDLDVSHEEPRGSLLEHALAQQPVAGVRRAQQIDVARDAKLPATKRDRGAPSEPALGVAQE